MSYADETPGYAIVTTQEAQNWVTHDIELLERVRRGFGMRFESEAKTKEFHQQLYQKFLEQNGGILGKLTALYRCMMIDKDLFARLKSETLDLLGPSMMLDRYGWCSPKDVEHEITGDESIKWLSVEIDTLHECRADCNVMFPDDDDKTKDYQTKAFGRLLVKRGGVLGMLVALHRCKKIGDVAYNEIREKALVAGVPIVVGNIGF